MASQAQTAPGDHDCETLADKIRAGDALSPSDVTSLSQLCLPLLGKLIELRRRLMPVRRDRSIACGDDAARIVHQRVRPCHELHAALLALRDELAGSDARADWRPALDRPLDGQSLSDDEPSGIEVLKAMAIARIVLPANVAILAPLALLGDKAAQAAQHFGADGIATDRVGETPADASDGGGNVLPEWAVEELVTPLSN